jgi:RimJ/RimL family protein N-acetyltransferase
MNLTHVEARHGAVALAPLQEAHRPGLAEAASDPTIWRHWARPVLAQGWDKAMDWQMQEQAAGRWLLHTVFFNQQIIGQTCYLVIRPDHAGVEVGGTWYAPTAQGTMINPTCKLLMLGHAFACGAERVELKTDVNNTRSRAAILKLGATFEGIHRHHMRRVDGTWRDTVWYSVLREEWPRVKAGLEARLT